MERETGFEPATFSLAGGPGESGLAANRESAIANPKSPGDFEERMDMNRLGLGLDELKSSGAGDGI